MEVQYAGRRLPTDKPAARIRLAAERATYTISPLSSMLIEDDSWSCSVMCSRIGRAASTTEDEERKEKPRRSTCVLSR